jgi:hypothetical protein
MDENMDYTPAIWGIPPQIASFFFETKVSLFGGYPSFTAETPSISEASSFWRI